MKSITFATMLLVAAITSFAQTAVTLESNLKGSENVAALYRGNGTFAFVQSCEGGWWQTYAGATYSPTAWSQIALGIGAESEGFRYGGWLWLGQGRFSAIHLFEDGGSGPWHRTILKYVVSDELTLGLTDRAFYGRGLHAELSLSDSTKLTGELFEGGGATLALSQSF